MDVKLVVFKGSRMHHIIICFHYIWKLVYTLKNETCYTKIDPVISDDECKVVNGK